MKKELKILCIGNSFSVDTVEYLPQIAKSLGYENVKIANLYVGGCSINQHYHHICNDINAYEYFTNTGQKWNSTLNKSIKEAILEDSWDYISIQHGSNDGSRYTDINSYSNLSNLINKVKEIANKNAKIAFNMTWVGESDHPHPEIRSYNGDQLLIYSLIASLTKTHLSKLDCLDIISPTGTAIQNARTSSCSPLTRDGYHLSLDLGRYIASLTFLKALTNVDIDNIEFKPDLVSMHDKKIAIESANNAINNKFEITKSKY